MKIALLTNGIYPYVIGGIQKHSYYLAKGFAQRGIYVDIYHLKSDIDISVVDYFSKDELEYLTFLENKFPGLPHFPGHYIVENYLHSKNLYHLISDKQYDLIYAQGFTSWYFIKKEPFKRNLISNLHGLEMFQDSISFKNKLRSALLRIPSRKIILNSAIQISLGGGLKNILLQQGAKKESIATVPNGISEKWIVNNTDINKDLKKPIQFTFVGRNERRKGIIEIIEAVQGLLKEAVDFQFNFVGLTSDEVKLESPKIKYFGVLRDEEKIKCILDETDVLVCPSYSEGMPTVILEAMARGTAIIATDVGAVSELVSEINGTLIEKGNIGQLKNVLIKYSSMDSDDLLNLKINSLNKVSNEFVWNKVVDKTINLLKI